MPTPMHALLSGAFGQKIAVTLPSASTDGQSVDRITAHGAGDVQHAVVCLETGTKCLPGKLRSSDGSTLNDCHAEVLCCRALLRWLMDEACSALQKGQQGKSRVSVSFLCPARLLAPCMTRALSVANCNCILESRFTCLSVIRHAGTPVSLRMTSL